MIIGLTGGIGCGKTTVVGLFAEAGWQTKQSDQIVRDLLAEDTFVQTQIRSRWGESVFATDGSIDRKAIAKRVFENSEELKWLEALIHPRVRDTWKSAVSTNPQRNWLIEIPLLYEKRLETEFNIIVCVVSRPDVVEKRMVRRGYTPLELEKRRLQQLPDATKAQKADFLISNNGNVEFLKLQTTRLIAHIKNTQL